MSLKAEKGFLREPFLLKPAGKDYLWGGERLNDDFSKNIPMRPLAETWECSAHEDGLSVIGSGVFKGRTLKSVLQEYPVMAGTHCKDKDFPILVKFIDANKDLSVQVHPDDEYAGLYENGSLGKTEMWYVVDAAKDAELIYGFKNDLTKEMLLEILEKDEIEKHLNRVPVHKGDVFLITPGTVHAIGKGCLIAEVQESSNITYRLYDYHRVDKNGKERPLHIEKAVEVAKLKGDAAPRQPMRILRYKPGCASEFLGRCQYFEVEHLLLNTERIREMACINARESSFRILVCIDGCGVLLWSDTKYRHDHIRSQQDEDASENEMRSLRFFRGDTVFLPADSVDVKIHGRAEFLMINC